MKEYIAKKYVICKSVGMVEPGQRFFADYPAEKEKRLLAEGAIAPVEVAAEAVDDAADDALDMPDAENGDEGAAEPAEEAAEIDPTDGLISAPAEKDERKPARAARKAGKK